MLNIISVNCPEITKDEVELGLLAGNYGETKASMITITALMILEEKSVPYSWWNAEIIL